MNEKIIGVTVGTGMKPSKLEEKLNLEAKLEEVKKYTDTQLGGLKFSINEEGKISITIEGGE